VNLLPLDAISTNVLSGVARRFPRRRLCQPPPRVGDYRIVPPALPSLSLLLYCLWVSVLIRRVPWADPPWRL